jgi:hypothetical protein
MSAGEDAKYGSMTLKTLALNVAEIRTLNKGEREALLWEVQGRLVVASVLLERDDWVQGVLGETIDEWSSDELRRVLLGGPPGDFSDTLIGELEDQMRGGDA